MRVRIVVDPVLVASTASVINALPGWMLMAVVGVDKEGRYSIDIPHFPIDRIELLR